MMRDEVTAWAREGLRSGEDGAFWSGVLLAAHGVFDERRCGAAGSIWESDFCSGGREGMLRLEQAAPVGRVQHGAVLEAKP